MQSVRLRLTQLKQHFEAAWNKWVSFHIMTRIIIWNNIIRSCE